MNFRLKAKGIWNLLVGKWPSADDAVSVRRVDRVGDNREMRKVSEVLPRWREIKTERNQIK